MRIPGLHEESTWESSAKIQHLPPDIVVIMQAPAVKSPPDFQFFQLRPKTEWSRDLNHPQSVLQESQMLKIQEHNDLFIYFGR